MKTITKMTLALIATSSFLMASQRQDSIDNMQQKTNIILIKKVQMLQKKVQMLQKKTDQLETGFIKNSLELNKLKKTIASDTVENKNKKNILSKKIIPSISKEKKVKSNIDYANIYIMKHDCIVKNKKNKQKLFKKDSFIKIVKKGDQKSLTTSGFWIKKECYGKFESKNLKGGDFYKVNTYMANSREKPGAENNIESVFQKNDILYITGKVTAKDGGIWSKIKNDGYINSRIIKKIK